MSCTYMVYYTTQQYRQENLERDRCRPSLRQHKARRRQSCSRWNSGEQAHKISIGIDVSSLTINMPVFMWQIKQTRAEVPIVLMLQYVEMIRLGAGQGLADLVNSIVGHSNQHCEDQRGNPRNAVVWAETRPGESEQTDCFEGCHCMQASPYVSMNLRIKDGERLEGCS